jgi:hypothetical protein
VRLATCSGLGDVRFLGSLVLSFEALVVVLGIAPAITLADVPPAVAIGLGLGLSAACLVVAALLRYRWAFLAGSLIQVAVFATALVLPAMLLIGLLFGGLWALALVGGRRVDRFQHEQGEGPAAT